MYTTKKWVHNNLSFEEQDYYKQFLLQQKEVSAAFKRGIGE
jgi:hypothetical protein